MKKTNSDFWRLVLAQVISSRMQIVEFVFVQMQRNKQAVITLLMYHMDTGVLFPDCLL